MEFCYNAASQVQYWEWVLITGPDIYKLLLFIYSHAPSVFKTTSSGRKRPDVIIPILHRSTPGLVCGELPKAHN